MDLTNTDLSQLPVVKRVLPSVEEVIASLPAAIRSEAEFAAGGEWLKEIARTTTRVNAARSEIVDPLNKALKAANALFATPLARLTEARGVLTRAMGAYTQELERQRIAAQDKLNRDAERERAKLLAQASKAEARGKEERAVELESRAAMVTAPIATAPVTKVEGVSFRDHWCFEVTDPKLVPDQYKVIEESRIRGVVNSLKAATDIPGVRVWCEKRPVVRT